MRFTNEMLGQLRVRNLSVGQTINGTAMIRQTFKVVEILENGNAMVSLVDDNRRERLTPRVMKPKEMTIEELADLCAN
jgi:hypothetical protein